jgi:hypothetical protein
VESDGLCVFDKGNGVLLEFDFFVYHKHGVCCV